MDRTQAARPLFAPACGIGIIWKLERTAALPRTVFARLIAAHGLRHLVRRSFAIGDGDVESLAGLGTVEMVQRHPSGTTLVLRLGTAVMLVEAHAASATVELAASDAADADAAVALIAERFNPPDAPPHEVGVSFWAHERYGAYSEDRNITAPAWNEIATNYAAETADGLGHLVDARAPGTGRLILWHGEPGTGKTYALKALIRAWREWCAAHFITDPEAFLGDATAYLLRVLTSEDVTESARRPWKLVVLEDAGELLAADARAQTGQALSRLLNVTDGLLGQGMNALVLVTTNEPLRKLHPAVQRPGRCWRQVEFSPLSVAEANRWLSTKGAPARLDRAAPVSDLYAMLDGHRPREERPFGFARSG